MTQWGRDPIWDSNQPSTVTRVTDFPAAAHHEAVELLEQPGTSVHVVGHRVYFNPARRLWYCDIELNPGATYMPFVRLALVRYQPNAIHGASISRVVLAEFAQVLPRRRARLERQAGRVTMNVYGPVPDRGPMRRTNRPGAEESEYADISFVLPVGATGESGRNRMELVLQTRAEAIDSNLAWEDQAVVFSGPVSADAVTTAADAGGTTPGPFVAVTPAETGTSPLVRRGQLGGQDSHPRG